MALSINPTDILAVTFGRGSEAPATLTLSGAGTLGDVFRHVRAEAKGPSGILKITVRNRTQGWAQQHTILFRAPGSAAPAPRRSGAWGEIPSLFEN
ncbi:MAG: hypothetical protein K2K49_04510 [Duncaniella sp.]|nr:hypothetical protein [Duncaniella sp.]